MRKSAAAVGVMAISLAFFMPSLHSCAEAQAHSLRVGSKRFTESYILCQIIADVARSANETAVVAQPGLGNTSIVFEALKKGNIDLYADYTGTLAQELLHDPTATSLDRINEKLSSVRLSAGIPIGFSNGYSLVLTKQNAARLHAEKISDIARYPDLRLGFSHEFLNRSDGWKGLKSAYHLPQKDPSGFDHDLAYRALADGQIDVMEAYSTDPKIISMGLQPLEDDRHFFPDYEAVLVFQKSLPQQFPKTWEKLQRLHNAIDEKTMAVMNADREIRHISEQQIAANFVDHHLHIPVAFNETKQGQGLVGNLIGPDLWTLTLQHLSLVAISLILGIAVGVPLGVLAAKKNRWTQPVLGTVGIIQTVPSLALLAFLIPLVGTVGWLPAAIALFLYALLPIVRNTYTGLTDLPPTIKESAEALGLPGAARLIHIDLPLASRAIIAGVKTSAVINVGTATIAAFVGAGGFGERIIAGLSTGDNELMIAGAIPACIMALACQAIFDFSENWLVPAGLRQSDREALR